MTNEQMLKELIELAIKNGFSAYSKNINQFNDEFIKNGFIKTIVEEFLKENKSELLFNHDFAKAIFGESEFVETGTTETHIKCSNEKPCESFSLEYLDEIEKEIPKFCQWCGAKMVEVEIPIKKPSRGFRGHLMMLAITPEEDRIQYCYQNRRQN